MFTGIIEEQGTIRRMQLQEGGGAHLIIDARSFAKRLMKGDSVAVDGVCLTVTRKQLRLISLDVSQETLSKTNLKSRNDGHVVNLELPMTADKMVGGHFVQGHVEGTASVLKWKRRSIEDVMLYITLPRDSVPYCVEKG